MTTSELTKKERTILLQTLQQFRANYDESDGGYSNRDELETKLQSFDDCPLTELDIHVLKMALANEWAVDETYDYYIGLFPKNIV